MAPTMSYPCLYISWRTLSVSARIWYPHYSYRRKVMRVQFILPYVTTGSAPQVRVTGKVPRSLLRMLTRELFVAASEAWKGETCVSTVHLSLQPGYYSRCVPDFLYEIKIFTVSLVSSHTESLCAKCVSLRRHHSHLALPFCTLFTEQSGYTSPVS